MTFQPQEWHLIDAQNKVVGRLATRIAVLLQGKHRLDYKPHMVPAVYVVVTNTATLVLTGRKEEQKKYRRYSGYPGGLRERSAREVRARDATKLLWEAVFGMLPKNSLRKQYMLHLKLYPTATHPHMAQLNKEATV